jgi:hypothetical protein
MRSTLSASLALALALLSPAGALAQDPAPPFPVPPGAPEPPPVDPEPVPEPPAPPPDVEPFPASEPPLPPEPGSAWPAVKLEGTVDTYYLYNFTGDPSRQGPLFRAFDTESNSFTVNYAELSAWVKPDPVGLRLDLAYASFSLDSGMQEIPGFTLEQAYASARLPRWTALLAGLLPGVFALMDDEADVTLDAGKFVTTAGAEVIEAHNNWLYSRSLLFYGIPLVHTGLRMTVRYSPKVSFQASLVNSVGVVGGDPDLNAAKTGGVSLQFTPWETTTFVATSYFGWEQVNPSTEEFYLLVDFVASHSFTDAFALNLNFDYAKLAAPYWLGVSLMGRVVLVDPLPLTIALRGEFVHNEDENNSGLLLPTGGTANLFEGTLAVGLPIASNFEIRFELRGDFSNKDVFVKDLQPRDNQFTGTAAFLAFF